MDQVDDFGRKLSRAVQLEEAAERVREFPWDAVRERAASPKRVRGVLSWRWWLVLGVAGTCLSGTAAAMASPRASGAMQQVLAKIHVLRTRTVTLTQARIDAGYTVVGPAGLPAGTRLLAISELPALGSAPAEFLFQYQIRHQARNGPFEIVEAPAGRGSGSGFYVLSSNGALSIFAGRPAPSPAPPGAAGGTALAPGAPHPCPSGGRCGVQFVHVGGAAAGDGAASNPNAPGPVACPGGEVCVSTGGRPGDGAVTVSPAHLSGSSPDATGVSWTVGGTELHLINPGTLTQAEVEAIQAATKGS